MRLGGTLAQAQIAYETWGELNGTRDNGLLIFTGCRLRHTRRRRTRIPPPDGGKT